MHTSSCIKWGGIDAFANTLLAIDNIHYGVLKNAWLHTGTGENRQVTKFISDCANAIAGAMS
jgi:hypothetical protein